ncbi:MULTISPECIES: hypothetical protein [Vibrio]|uniref:hypothetical protein n=1 Tax=Vibrio TaxID=662 RepID=UPI00163C5F91|nr:hypothetical protein [Vibrio cholerae]HAS3381289.1 hypothetical protein [Vibrio cholerae]HAS3410316.1 hypothetical protein [Vibrio cholerae]
MAKKIEVRFEADVLSEMTEEQVTEWVLFVLGSRGSISNSNPMWDMDMEARHVQVDFK